MTMEDSTIEVSRDGLVGIVTLNRPPHNFFGAAMVGQIAAAFAEFDADPGCRAILLRANGTAFCAGAQLGDGPGALDMDEARRIYEGAVSLFDRALPVVAEIGGPAIGGGLGLLGGLAYTELANTSGFEGYSGFVVVAWMVCGIVVGLIAGLVAGLKLSGRG